MRSACRLWSKPRPVGVQGFVESFFTGVAERRMADVVASARASASSDSSRGAGEVREICVTSSVWVRRLRKWSPGARRRRG